MQSASSDGARAALWEDYCEDLAGWSVELIDEACRRYRRSEERWFPSTGQLLAILRQIAAERAPREVKRMAPPPKISDEERNKVAAMFPSLLAHLRGEKTA